MNLTSVFDIAGSGMAAETTRLTTSAENLTNANIEAASPEEAYKPRYPVFKAVQEQQQQWMLNQAKPGVKVEGILQSYSEPIKHYEPNNPLADENGFIYTSPMSYIEAMSDVISASRSYEMNIEILNKTTQLMQRTLQLGE